jgi:hypothetical protein
MRQNDRCVHCVALLVILAILSSIAALTTPASSEPEPSAFEANAGQ